MRFDFYVTVGVYIIVVAILVLMVLYYSERQATRKPTREELEKMATEKLFDLAREEFYHPEEEEGVDNPGARAGS